MTELYNKDILRLATSIPLTERLAAPDITVVRTSRICGSRVTADFIFDGGAISEYGQGVKACALGQASCSIFGHHIIGQTRETFAPVAEAMRRMLAGDGPAAKYLGDGEWAELGIFLAAREHKSRHGSIMLPFDAAMEAFDSLAGKKEAKSG